MVTVIPELPGQSSGRLIIKSPFALIIDGINIDDLLTDSTGYFETLTVSGRENPAYNINSKDVSSRDGAMYLSKNLATREIKVKGYIQDISNAGLQTRLSKLAKIFKKDVVKISFADDPNYLFYGTFSNIEVPDDAEIQGEVVFTFYCADPYKYRVSQTLTISNSQVLTLNTMFPVCPILDLTFSSAVTEFTIQNAQTGLVVRYKKLTGTSDATFKVDVLNGVLTSTVNKYDQLSGLVLTSDWEDFKIDNGQQLVITPAPTSIKLTYEGVYL
ncbi:distal tail protein Dit [Macrococcus capreoli]|uniref:distal tail protein Dit n=1 Tax=Macrococcus capreoli TaxID=2982690 RepID=UPI003EE6FE87